MNKRVFAGILAALCGGSVGVFACTSWVIHPSRSRSGRMIVHKCRDSNVSPLAARMFDSPGGRRWMRIGTTAGWNCFSMNDRGVVIILNAADTVSTRHAGGGRIGYGGGAFMNLVTRNCTAADQALPLIKYFCDHDLNVAPNSFFVADPKRAFLIDVAPGYFAVKELYGGMAIISNCMHLPGVERVSTMSWPGIRYDRLREANVRRELKRGRVNGKYTIPDTMRVSRLKWQKEQDKHLPFRKDSVSAATFEIDPEFPDVLSTAYIALGPQQHTVYLPTPMALEQFPKEIGDGSWGELAYSLRKAAGDDHDGLKRIVELEQKLFAEYDHVREQARSLLKAKRRGEAVKILNECYRRHFAAAKQLLAELNPAAK